MVFVASTSVRWIIVLCGYVQLTIWNYFTCFQSLRSWKGSKKSLIPLPFHLTGQIIQFLFILLHNIIISKAFCQHVDCAI